MRHGVSAGSSEVDNVLQRALAHYRQDAAHRANIYNIGEVLADPHAAVYGTSHDQSDSPPIDSFGALSQRLGRAGEQKNRGRHRCDRASRAYAQLHDDFPHSNLPISVAGIVTAISR
jgi:hypothetical protein